MSDRKKKKKKQKKRVGREKVGGVRGTWLPLKCVCGCRKVRKCLIKFLREKEEEEEVYVSFMSFRRNYGPEEG